ncbi:hypothetical protein [Synoicihabitans lomoniglobus]|uniref:Peptidase metallopeptidase domain-containing protein n=1 Tax=Synoicihabitans lomoniglobus TaxID=2909285 RepID=A0AAF0CQW2_9BACT|nr:hypothetical protein [Opitutaceae bacterium LMO-M01]WED66392.1 hypothetical protein PXH66_05970 [Opitutaceae bacterium LMO-M01]
MKSSRFPLLPVLVWTVFAASSAPAQISFQFDYTDANTGFNDPTDGAARRTALEQAAQILSDTIPTSTPVTVTFSVVSTNNDDSTLASAGSDSTAEDIGFSPTVVSQKIVNGTDANGAAADGEINWNFFHNWDLDDDVAPDAFDFKSTAMHELLHAMGFVSAISSTGEGLFVGTVGDPNAWYLIDQYLVTATGQSFVDTQFRFDAGLVGNLDDNPGIYFNGPHAVAANGGNPVAFYSPEPWEEGSSGSHTDDNTYLGTSALLMNAATDTGPGVRTLSAIELGILRDIGYDIAPTTPTDPPTTTSLTYLSNISVRTTAGSGDQTLSVGFAVSGGSKGMLIRGVGPTLDSFNITGAIADPQIALFSSAQLQLESNDDWDASASTTFSTVGAFSLPDGSFDSALVTSLAPGAYTVQVTDVNGASGIALAEIYDTAAPTSADGPRFTNISARSQVGIGAEVLTAGFVIAGEGTKTLLIRGIGPGLNQFSIAGAIADPQLSLFRSESGGSSTLVESNNDWNSATIAPTADRLGAFAITAGSLDSALLVTLTPGAYTVQLSGVANGTGVGIIEVYDAD